MFFVPYKSVLFLTTLIIPYPKCPINKKIKNIFKKFSLQFPCQTTTENKKIFCLTGQVVFGTIKEILERL